MHDLIFVFPFIVIGFCLDITVLHKVMIAPLIGARIIQKK